MFNLIYGDTIEEMSNLESGSIDMILCDLPYAKTKNEWDVIIPFDNLWKQYCRLIKENGAIVLFGQGGFSAKLILSNEKMYRYTIIWEKTQPSGFLNARKMPLRTHEDMLVFYKKLPTYNPQKTTGHSRKVSSAIHKRNSKKTTNYGSHGLSGYDSTERFPTSVWKFPKDTQKSALHPTQKPVELLKKLILTYSNKGDTILDNTMGVGSTGVSCSETERSFIGIENNQTYFDIATERIKKNEIKPIYRNNNFTITERRSCYMRRCDRLSLFWHWWL